MTPIDQCFIYAVDETKEHTNRIILTDTVNTEDCKMTERTVDQVSKDIRDQEKRIEARSFIIGPNYRKAIVSFDIKSDAGDYEDYRDSFKNWNNRMDDYFDGTRPGKIDVTIEGTGCENEVVLDEELLNKIDNIRYEISMDEQVNIMLLKQERKRLRNIEEKKISLEFAQNHNEKVGQRLVSNSFALSF